MRCERTEASQIRPSHLPRLIYLNTMRADGPEFKQQSGGQIRRCLCAKWMNPRLGLARSRVKVSVCAVCRTDIHITEGDLAPHKKVGYTRPSDRWGGLDQVR